jgi:hypothetical protein
LVLEEDAFNNFEALVKHVEFRHGTNRTVRPGMFLLFTNGWAARRRGRTGLLVAEVTAVHHCSVEEAYRRFPTDANQCNLQMRSARWSSRMISCIEVQNVRPAPEFRVLVPGNLGFLHQFSLEKGTPQFCLASDLEARPAAADTARAAAGAAVAGTGGDAAYGESCARGGGGGAAGRRMTSSTTKSDGCCDALEKECLNFIARQQGSGGPLAQSLPLWLRKPSVRQIDQHEYCNKEFYGDLKGSVTVSLEEKKVCFEAGSLSSTCSYIWCPPTDHVHCTVCFKQCGMPSVRTHFGIGCRGFEKIALSWLKGWRHWPR